MKNTKKGFSLMEIVVGAAVLTTVIITGVFAINSVLQLERSTSHIIRANYLLLEGVDVMRILRDDSWSTYIDPLSTSTPFNILWSGTSWEATTTETVIDGLFYRTISLSDVERDGSDNITTSGTYDPDTLLVTATVSWWNRNSTSSKSFQTYITNLYAN